MNNSTESVSNNQNQYEKTKNEENKEELPKRPEPTRNTLIHPSLVFSKSNIPPKNYGSNYSDKNYLGERLNSFCSMRSQQEFDLGQPLFPLNFKSYIPMIPSWHFPSFGYNNSNIKDEQKIKNKIDPKNIVINYFTNEDEDLNKDKKENKLFPNLFNYNIKNYENKWTSSKNPNINIINNNKIIQTNLTIPKMDDEDTSPKKEENINTNIGTKFFTNHNYGYKCSCSKTQCNRKYCECYNSGNYCVDCNCKNCNNKPPINSYTNKRPLDEQSKSKKEKVICTCTKSGCNKNYCECFKIGQKCSSLCRCIGCENNDQILNKKYNNNYQCNSVNSIFIIKNKLYIEDIKRKKKEELFEEKTSKRELIGINKKRKREDNKNEEDNINNTNKIKKIENQDDLNLFNDSLFDENGKVILSHINLFHI